MLLVFWWPYLVTVYCNNVDIVHGSMFEWCKNKMCVEGWCRFMFWVFSLLCWQQQEVRGRERNNSRLPVLIPGSSLYVCRAELGVCLAQHSVHLNSAISKLFLELLCFFFPAERSLFSSRFLDVVQVQDKLVGYLPILYCCTLKKIAKLTARRKQLKHFYC